MAYWTGPFHRPRQAGSQARTFQGPDVSLHPWTLAFAGTTVVFATASPQECHLLRSRSRCGSLFGLERSDALADFLEERDVQRDTPDLAEHDPEVEQRRDGACPEMSLGRASSKDAPA